MANHLKLPGRGLAWLATVSVAAVIVVLTLTPTGADTANTALCLICGTRGLADALLNVILFLPFGAALYAAVRSITLTGLGSAALSAGIELTQMIWVAGRDSSAGDVFFNTAGGLLGGCVALSYPFWTDTSVARRWRLAGGMLSLALGVLASSAALLSPHLPDTPYFGQWTPRFTRLEWYRGEVLYARVGGVHIPSRRVDDSAALRSSLDDGAPVELTVVAGPPVTSRAPIFNIADDGPNSIRFIGIDRDDAVFRYRALSSAIRLDEPYLRIPNAFAGVVTGDTIRVAVSQQGDSFCVGVAEREVCAIGYRLRDTWRVFYSGGNWSNPAIALIGIGWLAGLFAPLGFFLYSVRELVRLAPGVLAGVVAIPFFTPVMPIGMLDVAASFGGMAFGLVVRRILLTRRSTV